MEQTKSPNGRGRKKKSDPDVKYPPTKKSPEKEFVEGSGVPKDQIKVGFKLMAASFDGKWYQGRIVEVDGNDNTFLVHFDYWNSRFDEWYKFTTKKVKPLEDEPYMRKKHTPKFVAGDAVLAKWVDGKQYRGKVDKVKSNDKYDVVFEDGVVYSTTVEMLKLGDKIDQNLEVERFTKQQEQFKRSRERENRSIRRSIEPGSVPVLLPSSLQDVCSITAVKYTSKIPHNLILNVSFPLKKVSFSYQTKLNANTFTSRGKTFNVPNAQLVFDTEATVSAQLSSPELNISDEFSPRKRGRPKVHDTPLPTKHLRSDFSKSKSPQKKIPSNHSAKSSNARSPERSEEKSAPKSRKSSVTLCTVSVQTDPVPELTEQRTPLTSSRVDSIQPRPPFPLPPSSHQGTPSLLQTETVLTSDGRWITIATPPTNPASSDLIPRTPASNFYYQLVPMGANGPIQPPPPPILPPTQPQDSLQPIQPLVLTQQHAPPVMMLPQGQTLVQQPHARTVLQPPAPYIQQQRPIMQYQPTSAGLLQPANTVLMHTNTVPAIQPQHVVIPQQQQSVVATQPNVVNIQPQNPVIPLQTPAYSLPNTAPSDLGANPPVAQRQSDSLQLAGTTPLPVSPGPLTSPTNTSSPFPPVSSNLAASRATIRLLEVQPARSKETPPITGEQTENGGLDTTSPLTTTSPLISLSSRLPFSSLLSNAKQPLPPSPMISPPSAPSGGETGDVAIATIFAPPPSDSLPPAPDPLPPTHNQIDTSIKKNSSAPLDNNSNQPLNAQVLIQNDKSTDKEST